MDFAIPRSVPQRLYLIVEDDPISQLILSRLVAKACPQSNFLFAEDCIGCINYIDRYTDSIAAVFLDEKLVGDARGTQIARQIRNLVPVHTPALISVSGTNIMSEDDKLVYDVVWGKPYPGVHLIKLQLNELEQRRQRENQHRVK